jgi:hypothetical protein
MALQLETALQPDCRCLVLESFGQTEKLDRSGAIDPRGRHVGGRKSSAGMD